ncbi:integrase core domain-containing protein [Chloroflexota bacterium]
MKEWRKEYNQVRLHSSLGYRPPDPQAIQPYNMVPALT